MLRRNSVTVPIPPGVAYWAMAWVSSVAGSALTPTPGLSTFTTSSPMSSANVVTSSKYTSARPPALPTSRSFAIPAMPVTTVQKMIGAMSSRMSFMKPSPRGFRLCARCGQKMPSSTPAAMATSTCKYSVRQTPARRISRPPDRKLPAQPAASLPRPRRACPLAPPQDIFSNCCSSVLPLSAVSDELPPLTAWVTASK